MGDRASSEQAIRRWPLDHQFTVAGIPVSSQAKNKKAKRLWAERVKKAALALKPQGVEVTVNEVSVAIVYFYHGATDLDLDNIAKPILDALNDVVYVDDGQVSQILLRKSPLSEGTIFDDPEPVLLDAIDDGG
ncbi:MAG: RusA family crossover junction endodeoxyribonuclease, partial [Rhodospirillales bacterium]|nr:RusA family crossover junction endodeoxyribonuclease [Rhodospirillales bacterium]